MTDLRPLLARLEEATGPSREIDAHLAVALDMWPDWCRNRDGSVDGHMWIDTHERAVGPVVRWNNQGHHGKRNSAGNPPIGDYAAYSSSIDASLALVEDVLPGFCVLMAFNNGHGPSQVSLRAVADVRPQPLGTVQEWPGHGHSTSLPIAILIALLRALISNQTDTRKEGGG